MSSKFPKPKQFFPKNPNKYKGNPDNIWSRSSWETKLMQYFDLHPDVLWWSSEEISIKYFNPIDKMYHKYFPDFMARIRNTKKEEITYMIEVKPYKQTLQPEKKKRKSKNFLIEMATYTINQSKWRAADIFCQENGIKFKIITEHSLFGTKEPKKNG